MSDEQLMRRELHFGALADVIESESDWKIWAVCVCAALTGTFGLPAIWTNQWFLVFPTLLFSVAFVVILFLWLVPALIVDIIQAHHDVVRNELFRRSLE